MPYLTAQTSAPPYQGSYLKGVGASILFQMTAFLAGVTLYASSDPAGTNSPSASRRQAIGFMLTLLWGFTHMILVLPMALRWSRRAQPRSLKGMFVTSIVCAIPSCLCVANLVFLQILPVAYEKIKRLVEK
jgi:hypothetical protein